MLIHGVEIDLSALENRLPENKIKAIKEVQEKTGASLEEAKAAVDAYVTSCPKEPRPASYCSKCGAALGEGAKFCGGCGAPVHPSEQASGQEWQQLAGNSSSFLGKLGKGYMRILQVAVIAVVIFAVVSLSGKHPVSDTKKMVFDQYGPQTFGEAVESGIPEAVWDSTKVGSKHYTVTVSGFCPDLSSNVQMEFDVNYSGDYAYAKLTGITVDGEYYDDIFTTALVIEALYN